MVKDFKNFWRFFHGTSSRFKKIERKRNTKTSFLEYQKWNMKNIIPSDSLSKLTMSFKLSVYQLITKINGKPFLQIFLVMFNLFEFSFFNRNISRAFVGKLFCALSECFRFGMKITDFVEGWRTDNELHAFFFLTFHRSWIQRRISLEIKKTVKNSETCCVICMFCAFFNGFSSLTIHQLIFWEQ